MTALHLHCTALRNSISSFISERSTSRVGHTRNDEARRVEVGDRGTTFLVRHILVCRVRLGPADLDSSFLSSFISCSAFTRTRFAFAIQLSNTIHSTTTEEKRREEKRNTTRNKNDVRNNTQQHETAVNSHGSTASLLEPLLYLHRHCWCH